MNGMMDYFERARYFRTKKRLGQNFLINADVISDIIEFADIKPDDVILEISDLPKAIKTTIKELEEYDQNNDPMFFECADMLYMMADRFLKDGAIDSSTHDKLIMKYPIA